jgi:hypothetical protein
VGPVLRAGSKAEKRPRSRLPWIGKLALVLSGIVVGAALSEIGVRIFAPQPMTGRVSEYAPRGYFVVRSSGSVRFTVGESTGVYHFIPPHLRRQPPPADAAHVLVLGDSFTFGRAACSGCKSVAAAERREQRRSPSGESGSGASAVAWPGRGRS